MPRPGATYRIQFRKEFAFRDAGRIVAYLRDLGISHLYASPIFAARPGSSHGYDVVDPGAVNRELGGARAFRALRESMNGAGLGWIQDIVPNHMAYDGANAMLMDVFEHGASSAFRRHFDVDWGDPGDGRTGRVLAPHLGRFFGEALEAGEIRLEFADGGLRVGWGGASYPLLLRTWPEVLGRGLDRLDAADPAVRRFRDALRSLGELPADPGRERRERVARCRETFRELYAAGGAVAGHVDRSIEAVNGRPGDPATFNRLEELLGRQAFRLAFWKVAAEEINYRRFFTVNGLISMRVEREEVFRDLHALVLRSVWRGDFDGLRVDHVDGLYDPSEYLHRLAGAAPGAYIVVEKILADGEELPGDWPVAGTTGYDFLNALNTLLCDPAGEAAMTAAYDAVRREREDYGALVAAKKRLIIGRHMAGDVDALARLLRDLASRDRHARDLTLYGLRRALVEILALFPVYRTYVDRRRAADADRAVVERAAAAASASSPALVLEIAFIARFLLLEGRPASSPEEREAQVDFAMRFQQLSGPIMAKGFEDTTLYVYNRMIGLNEVGGSPDRFGSGAEEFHRFVTSRRRWPAAMNATATHDTKRGEDVRARLGALAGMAEEWRERVERWRGMNAGRKLRAGGREIPDPNDEYYLYQTLVGAYPFDRRDLADFPDRVAASMIKAVREAKVHTAWLRPDDEYEQGTEAFARGLLDRSKENAFLADFLPFQERVARCGVVNSLAQALLKTACPGVPDVYQGSELWDFNLVDPDNRRPVDFGRRALLLAEMDRALEKDRAAYIRAILREPEDGRIKLFTLATALRARRSSPALAPDAEYVPLAAEGGRAGALVAFARRAGEAWEIAVAPIRPAGLAPDGRYPLGGEAWGETAVALPPGAPDGWVDRFTGAAVRATDGRLPLALVLAEFPVALLRAPVAEEDQESSTTSPPSRTSERKSRR